MKEYNSPEEKLLKLIRNPRKQVAANRSEAVSTGQSKTAVIQSGPDYAGKPFYSLAGAYFAPANLLKILMAILVVSCLYLGACFLYPLFAVKKIKLPVISVDKTKQQIPVAVDATKPYEFYADEIRKRTIFTNTAAGSAKVSAVSGEAQSIKDISLLGIISEPNPQAIVEDKKTQKTYYVTKGQFIGEFEVEDIQEGKIILNSKGKRYELNI